MAGHPGPKSDPKSDLEELIETESAVHVVFRVDRPWDGDRRQAVAEAEAKIARLKEHMASRAFREAHGGKTGVLRMRTSTQPPAIVTQLMAERRVEVEAMDQPRAQPGERCVLCGREGLWEDQVSMVGQGWACTSCFHAWGLQQDARLPRFVRLPLGRLRSGKVIAAVVAVLLVLCAYGAYWTLDRAHRMNQVIRAHLPSGE